MNKWEHFTQQETDVIYMALSLYRFETRNTANREMEHAHADKLRRDIIETSRTTNAERGNQ